MQLGPVLNFTGDKPNANVQKQMFLGVMEAIVGSLFCCGVGVVQCFFNLLYYFIYCLHPPTTPRNYPKIYWSQSITTILV